MDTPSIETVTNLPNNSTANCQWSQHRYILHQSIVPGINSHHRTKAYRGGEDIYNILLPSPRIY